MDMKISIKGSGLEVTPAITEYINDKIGSLDKFLERFEHRGEAESRVEISRTTNHHQQGDVFRTEVNLYVNGETIRAEHTSDDIRAAVDKVKDILKIEIEKYKEKHEIDPGEIRKKKLSE